jgi:photosynthetic reaction center cytochrome c subunit
MKSITVVAGLGLLAAAAFVLFVPTWNRPPYTAEEVAIPANDQFLPVAARYGLNKPPPPLPPAANGGPSATATYKNVKVLTDVSAAEFVRLQTAITAWVAPKQGCSFCHAGTDWASDAKPQKQAARIMLTMTRHLNSGWSTHVAPAGMTCYTCHRGQPVPGQAWFPDAPKPERRFVGYQDNWQESADTVRKFFPDNGFAEYFLDDQPIAVISTTSVPDGTIGSWPEAKRIYEMMMQLSDGIGVNCGYCHQSRAFQDWKQSSPHRWTAWYAIRMVRDLNRNFLLPVADIVQESRTLEHENSIPVIPVRMKGTQTGEGLVVCATCHFGLPQPMNGANMLKDYPGLAPVTAPAGESNAHAGAASPMPG